MPPAAGSIALVTGASSGIGFELARCFARDGHGLIIAARHEDKLARAAEALRMDGAARVEAVPVDLSKPDGPAKLFQAVQQLGLEVEFLANNAGRGVFGDFTRETDLYDELAMIQLNAISVLHLTKLFAKPMVERGSGRILITSSLTARAVSPNLTDYSATKAFSHALAEGLANELKGTGVTVTSLLPDATETNFFKAAGMGETTIGTAPKANPADVAAAGYEAMMKGQDHVTAPTKSRITAAIASVLPESFVTSKAKAQ